MVSVRRMAMPAAALVFAIVIAVLTNTADIGGICREIYSGGTTGRQALLGSLWYAPLPLMLHVPFIDAVLFFVVLYKLCVWTTSRRLFDWVILSFALAALLLCGMRFMGFAVAVLAVLPLVIITDPVMRPRLQGLLFTAYVPSLYAIGCWLLMSYLVLGDAVYAWRGISALAFSFRPAFVIPLVVFFVLAVVFALFKFRPLAVFASALLLLCAWFAVLDSAGLDWAIPGSRGRAGIKAPDKEAVAAYVKNATPWGRVFVCGYNGFGKSCADEADEKLFVPCIDLHIGELRKAYVRQQLFILVPKPECENALESCNWRYGDLYANGAQRLLFAGDFDDWRLYEVISSEK